MKLNDFLDAVNLAIDNGEITGDQEIVIVDPTGKRIPMEELTSEIWKQNQYSLRVGDFVLGIESNQHSSTC